MPSAAAVYLLFDEVPAIEVYLGSAMIFGATLYVTRREAVLRKRAQQ